MPVFVNISGAWQKVTSHKVKIDGSFVDLTKIMVNVSGTWMTAWEYTNLNLIWDKDTYLVLDGVTATQINTAISEMTDGGILLFGEGSWLINQPITINNSNIEIKGVQNATKFISSVTNGDGVISIYGTSDNSLNNIIIDGITITKPDTNSGSGIYAQFCGTSENIGVEIKNCVISHNIGVFLTNIENSIIDSNTIQNTDDDGLYIYKCENIIISNNTIQNTIKNGIRILESESINTKSNLIFNNTNGGIYASKNTLSMFHGNILQNSISAFGWDNDSNLNLAFGNMFNHSYWEGIYYQNGNYNTIVANNSHNSFGATMEGAYYNSFLGNVLSDNYYVGIEIRGAVNYNLINGNVVVDNNENNISSYGGENTMNHNIVN